MPEFMRYRVTLQSDPVAMPKALVVFQAGPVSYSVEESLVEREFVWTRSYEWLRGRVRFEKQIAEYYEDSSGNRFCISRMTTGEEFWTWIPVWWWRRLRFRHDVPLIRRRRLRLPKARLLR